VNSTLTPEQREALNAVVAQEDARFTPDPMDTAIFAAGLRYAYEDAKRICEEEKVDAIGTSEEADYAYNRACDDIANTVASRIPKDSA